MTDMPFEGSRLIYDAPPLDEGGIPPTPMALLRVWIDDVVAGGVDEPTAMSLATADGTGRVASRVVLMRQLSERGVVFFSNYESAKGDDIGTNPQVAALFLWREFHRQVRVEGLVTSLAPEESDRYFTGRPRESQIGAWASPQSQTIPDRASLDGLFARCEERFDGQDVPRPPHWGGYLIDPRRVEFWQGRPNRLHDRIVYEPDGSTWSTSRLAP